MVVFSGKRPVAGLAAGLAILTAASAHGQQADWSYHGGPASDRYSPLSQITPANVTGLKEAWRFPMDRGGLQSQPLVIGRTVYAPTTTRKVVALDAVTGQPKWTFDAKLPGIQPVRGLASWRDGGKLRILFGCENFLYMLDADTGQPVTSFGDSGRIDARANLRGKAEDNGVFLTPPVAVYQDLLIVNGRVAEHTPASPGDVRAFDARTGKLVWTFHTVPHPGEPGAETWPKDAHLTQGGANAWTGATIDQARGIVFVNTGSPADDFYGAKRLGDNRFANSTIALDAKTGKRVWDFQQIHHDIWDSDSTQPPVLTTITRGGRKVDVTVASNKAAYLYVFERTTGKPIFPIVETPVPPSNVPGEVAARTQPIPTLPKPLSKKVITIADLNQSTPEIAAASREAFSKLHGNGQPFVPLGYNQDTLIMPGFSGSLGGMAADRAGILYAAMPGGAGMTRIVDNTKAREQIGEPGAPPPFGGAQNGYQRLDYGFTGYNSFRVNGQSGLSAATMMGTLNAVDLNTGQYRWTVPLPNRNPYSGPLVTATGLLFIAAGDKLQGYATADGKLLWEQKLPGAMGNGAGSYMVDGKQYVVLAAGGGSEPSYVAYALQ
jgi:quinoprotein glucose dehydrogenase